MHRVLTFFLLPKHQEQSIHWPCARRAAPTMFGTLFHRSWADHACSLPCSALVWAAPLCGKAAQGEYNRSNEGPRHRGRWGTARDRRAGDKEEAWPSCSHHLSRRWRSRRWGEREGRGSQSLANLSRPILWTRDRQAISVQMAYGVRVAWLWRGWTKQTGRSGLESRHNAGQGMRGNETPP